jgi:putative two-component system response regulator
MADQNLGKVLIVDDDPTILKIVGISLEKEGFEIAAALNGVKALELVREGQFIPDCVLLDYRMPEMSGIELLEILKIEYPLIPVIMLTALTDLEVAVETMKAGAFDYVVKPVRKIHLTETVKKSLRYRDILIENEWLANENEEYRRSLEIKVAKRTNELIQAYKKLKQTNMETVKLLAETIEAKDPYTRGHCNRVRILSSEIAHNLGVSRDKIEILEYGALLHDIGKIGVSEILLNKHEKLTEKEKRSFQMHTVIGEHILSTVEFFQPCLKIIRNHHEWHDGSGYPDEIKGKQIDLSAKIVTIADAFDAMTSTRPYREALPVEAALSEIVNGKGRQFDPSIVTVFINNELYKILPQAANSFVK